MPAVVELDRRSIGADQLKPMVGGVVDLCLRIAGHDDARRDETAGVGFRVVQHRQGAGDVDAGGHHLLLRRGARHHRGRARRRKRAVDAGAQFAVVQAERRLARLLRAQQIADHGRVVGFDRAEKQRALPVELFVDSRRLEMRVDGIAVGQQLSGVGDTAKSRAKPCIEGIRSWHWARLIPDVWRRAVLRPCIRSRNKHPPSS